MAIGRLWKSATGWTQGKKNFKANSKLFSPWRQSRQSKLFYLFNNLRLYVEYGVLIDAVLIRIYQIHIAIDKGTDEIW